MALNPKTATAPSPPRARGEWIRNRGSSGLFFPRAHGWSLTVMIFLLNLVTVLLSAQQDEHLYRTLKHKMPVLSLAFSPDSKLLATGGEDQMIYLWDIASGELIRTIDCQNQPIRYISFSPDGSTILAAAKTSILLWNLSGQFIRTFPGNVTHVWNVIFSPDGKYFYNTSLQDRFVKWDVETAAKVFTYLGHSKTVLSVAASNDGKLLASGSLDQSIIFWDAVTGTAIKTINAHGGNIYSVGFSPDNRYLVSASMDETAKIWDVSAGTIVRILEGHEYAVMQAKFSPDGRYIITASYDRTAKLWESATGRSIYTFADHSDVLNAASFSPDGNLIATASNDGTAMIWKTGPCYIAEYYYFDKIQEEFSQAAVLRPKDKAESKTDYGLRLEKGEKFRQDIYMKYFLEHQSVLDSLNK